MRRQRQVRSRLAAPAASNLRTGTELNLLTMATSMVPQPTHKPAPRARRAPTDPPDAAPPRPATLTAGEGLSLGQHSIGGRVNFGGGNIDEASPRPGIAAPVKTVMKPPSSLTRNRQVAAISSTLPCRPSGN